MAAPAAPSSFSRAALPCTLPLLLPPIFFLLLLLGAFSSCSKDVPALSRYEVGFSVETPETLLTRAGDIGGDAAADDKVYRLDLLVFDGESPYPLLAHETYTSEGPDPVDLSAVRYSEYAIAGTKRAFLALANLDPDSVEYVRQYLCGGGAGSTDYAYVPLSAGNYSTHVLPMVGCALLSSLSRDTELPVKLYRPMFRVEIGTITADFTGDYAYLMDGEVSVRTIALTNLTDMMTVVQGSSPSVIKNDTEALFGTTSSISKPFGYTTSRQVYRTPNRKEYYAYDLPASYSNASRGGTGKMALQYATFYNYNAGLGKGALSLDGPASLVEASTQVYDTDEGEGALLGGGGNGVLTVDKVLYGLPTALQPSFKDILCDFSVQDRMPKLVLEVLIGGRPYFYPIPMKYPQPNTTYRISNITLRGLGSEYSNFFEKQYFTSSSPVLVQWATTSVADVSAGYKTELGEAIY